MTENITTVFWIMIITALALLTIILASSLYKHYKEKERVKKEKLERLNKKYVISASKKHRDGSNIFHYHGYNSDKWIFTYDEALANKKRISHLFHEVQIIEYRKGMIKTDVRVVNNLRD